jgi:hypothetical protein
MQMKLTPPKAITFWISIILVIVGLLGFIGIVAASGTTVGFWLVFVGFVLLVAGLLIKGL